MKLWGYSNGDSLKNRRNLAFWSAIYSLVFWPNFLIFLNLEYGLEIDFAKALLIYVGTVASGTIGGYVWGAVKDQVLKMGQQTADKGKDEPCGD